MGIINIKNIDYIYKKANTRYWVVNNSMIKV